MAQLKLTHEILAAAIEGFEVQKQRLDEKISEIRQMLDGGSRTEATATTDIAKPRRKRSAAVRKKMALAQRARYAKLRQSSVPKQAESAKPKKRVLSAAGRKAISIAAKKRWSAIKAAKRGKPPVPGRKKAVARKSKKLAAPEQSAAVAASQ